MENNQKDMMLETNDTKHHKKEQEPGLHTGGNKNDSRKKFTFSIWYFIIAIILIIIFNNMFFSSDLNEAISIDYSQFKSYIEDGTIVQVAFDGDQYIGYGITKSEALKNLQEIAASKRIPASIDTSSIIAYQTYRIDDPSFVPLLDSKGVEYYATEPAEPSALSYLISMLLPVIIFFVFYAWLSKRLANGAQGVMSFNQNKSKLVAENDTGVRFADVAGEDEAKAELVEVVDFLKNPQKYTEMGAHIPKGVLLVGPPGTGKTLLAKAVAGEAGVPFFRMSGADFVEMFVGVGAARVRDLFKQAKEKSPCIIFIDEIDAIGRKRSDASIGGNDEREQTLNQLLVEMDGFEENNGVIVISATNRPDVLDPALLRPGRFDRRVYVLNPDIRGREKILRVHLKKVPLSSDVDPLILARGTPGFSGADLANLVNEAALLSARRGKRVVGMDELEDAKDKVMMGTERRSMVMTDAAKKLTAYHEAGHAVVSRYLETQNDIKEISIIPRGVAGGYTMYKNNEDKYYISKTEMEEKLVALLGGRAAEKLVLDDISTGASNDLEVATNIAKDMITVYGMSDTIGPISLKDSDNPNQMIMYGEKMQDAIGAEIKILIDTAYRDAQKLLIEHRDKLDIVANKLLEKEKITEKEFYEIFND